MSIVSAEKAESKNYFEAPNQSTGLTSLRSTTNQSQPKPAAQVGFFSVQWHDEGFPDEIIVLPLCSSCGLVISDLSMGVAVIDFPVEQSFEPIGEIGNYGQYGSRPIKKVPGQLFFFHKGVCDTVHGIYNIELDKIFRLDQRYDSQVQQDNDNE